MSVKYKIKLFGNVRIHFQTPEDGYSYFFGYYDKNPLNRVNSRLLAHRVNFDGRDIKSGDQAEVGYFNLHSQKFHVIGKTSTFNWQQGSHLQWLPGDYSRFIIYNDSREGKFVSIIYDLETREQKVIPFSIYSIHPSGDFALSVNYERLFYCRPGYRYFGVNNPKWDCPYHVDDGIFKVDLKTGMVKQLISTRDVVLKDSLPSMHSHDNWLEHMMWNPSGTRFAFFHRWDEGLGRQATRLYTVNADGTNLYAFPHTGFYSHMGWKNDKEFTIWTTLPSVKNKIFKQISSDKITFEFARQCYRFAKKIIPQKLLSNVQRVNGYVTFEDLTHRTEVLSANQLPINGHNSWDKKGGFMLTDSYPDENGYRWLWYYSNEARTRRNIAQIYSYYNDCGYRADLHPRLSYDEKLITVDFAIGEKRQMAILGI